MGVKIHIQPQDVWAFFDKNIKRLSDEMVIIAENTETEYAVYLTEESGYPLFIVCQGDDDAEYDEGAINQKDCEDTAKRCFLKYLYPVTVTSGKYSIPFDQDDDDFDSELTKMEMEDTVYEREDELVYAMGDFLQNALREGVDGTDVVDTLGLDIINDILDTTLQYIADAYDLPIYRPTFVTDENGSEEYVEYPYNSEEPEDLSDSLSYE